MTLCPKHDDVIKWKHFPRKWPFVRGIHRSPVNPPRKGQWRGALMFSLICVWINGWVNKGEAGDLRRYRAHYDVIVMGGRQNETMTDQTKISKLRTCRNTDVSFCRGFGCWSFDLSMFWSKHQRSIIPTSLTFDQCVVRALICFHGLSEGLDWYPYNGDLGVFYS